MKYTRQELEKLSDLGIFPSKLGIGEEHDTSAKYLERGVDIDDDGVVMIYDKSGGEELPIKISKN